MAAAVPIIIGEITVDFTMPTRDNPTKIRLGGVVHAARGMWAAGLEYSVGAFCPKYLVSQAQDYLSKHGCKSFILLGEITGAPNVFAIADVREVGHQGYEDLLRDVRSIIPSSDEIDLGEFEPVVIFPGSYNLFDLINRLRSGARVTIDVAYDVDDENSIALLTGKIYNIVISTSSDLFLKFASKDITPLLNLVKKIGAKHLLLKENRGGSRLFDLVAGNVEQISATLTSTENSVGVGDAFTAVFGTISGNPIEAAWRGMQVATIYSQTTWPDDLKRDVKREFKLPIEHVRNLGSAALPWHNRPELQIYLAAPDFTYKSYDEIEMAVSALEYHNFKVRRPVKENGEAKCGTPILELAPYYFKDVELLRECSAVFAMPIDRDPGTLIEIGMAIEMGIPVVTFDPRNQNLNTMVVVGSSTYSNNLDLCLNGLFEAMTKLQRSN